MIEQNANRIIYRYNNEKVWIEPWGKDSVRVRAAKMPEMPSENWALEEKVSTRAEIHIDKEQAALVNGKIKVVVSRLGKITYLNAHGKVILEEYVRNRDDVTSEKCSALCVDAREFKPILGGDFQLAARFESDPSEKIYGMGQYQQPYLDLKGCELELAQRNSQASVPFMISSLGYGFLWNNPAVGNVVFGKNRTTWHAISTKVLDYWVTAGDTPAELIENYASVTGTVPMMPEYGLGFWQCKLRYQSQKEILDVAREYKRRGVPLSVIVIDFFHWPKEGEWKFDPEFWPDPAGMVKELQEMGTKVMISIWPTVDHKSENYADMREKGLLINVERGFPNALFNVDNTMHIDVTNPETRKYVWDIVKKNYYESGIQIFWLDEAEPEYDAYHFDNYRYHLGPNVQIGNIYPKEYAKLFYEGMESEGQENIMNLIRCAWAGSQKYGALVWSGDIGSSYDSMRNQLAAGLNMGLAGIPWWTTDICGFHGGNPDDPEFRELFLRWFAYGTFCPVMRLHGDREPHKEALSECGGGRYPSGADNEIWSYGEEAYEICRNYIFIRERLKPYIRELMQEAHEKGTPVIRPLFYDFTEDRNCWDVEDQYMFGKDIVVAPVLYPNMEERQVYLPKVVKWYDLWSGEEFAGGQKVTVKTPIDKIPLFSTKPELVQVVKSDVVIL